MNKKILFFCAIIILIVMFIIGIKYQDKIGYVSRKYNKTTKNEINIEENFKSNIEDSQKIVMYNELQYNLNTIAKDVFENLNISSNIEYVKLSINNFGDEYMQKEYTYEAYTKDYKVTFYERSKDIKIEVQNFIAGNKKIEKNKAEEIAKNLVTKYEFLDGYEFKELLEDKDLSYRGEDLNYRDENLSYSAIYYTDKRDKNNNLRPTMCKVIFDSEKEEVIKAEYTYENILSSTESDMKIEVLKAIENAKKELKKVEYTDYGDNYSVQEGIVTPNNFFSRKSGENEVYGNIDKKAYIITFYSQTKSELIVFVDIQTGEVIGGRRR